MRTLSANVRQKSRLQCQAVPTGSSRDSIRVIDLVVVFAGTLVYLWPFAGVLTRIGDEGTLVNGAALTASGAVPYRDFADLANPLSYYWLGAWFAVFGTEFAVARWQLILTGATSAVALCWLTSQAYGRLAGLLTVLLTAVVGIPFWPGTNHHWDSNLFLLVALVCLAAWQRRSTAVWECLTGLAAAATSGFMIEKGVFVLLVALGMVWRDDRGGRRRAALRMVAAFATGVAAMTLAFVWQGAAWEFLYVNLIFPAARYEGTRRLPYAFYFSDVAWHSPLALARRILPAPVAFVTTALMAVPVVVVALAPLASMVLMAERLYRGRESWRTPQVTLWAGGVALMLSEGHRWDLFHLIYGAPLLLGGLIGETLSGTVTLFRRRLAGVLAVCTMAQGIWQGAIAVSAHVRHDTRRGPVRTHEPNDALQFLLDRTTPGEYVFVYPYYAMYHFLANVQNPTRYAILMYGYNTVEQFRESVQDLERTKPRYVLWDTLVDGGNWTRWYPAYLAPREEDRIIEPYLTRHYRMIDMKSGFRIMERVEDARPTP